MTICIYKKNKQKRVNYAQVDIFVTVLSNHKYFSSLVVISMNILYLAIQQILWWLVSWKDLCWHACMHHQPNNRNKRNINKKRISLNYRRCAADKKIQHSKPDATNCYVIFTMSLLQLYRPYISKYRHLMYTHHTSN